MVSIFNAALTNAFQASDPFTITGEAIVLDMLLSVANIAVPGTAARIEWYFEFASDDPNATTTNWYREVAEEDIGNGDVRMSTVIRRFATNASDAPLPEATYRFDMQFARRHNFCRIQIRVLAGGADNCRATVLSVLGSQPLSAPI
jgi:hypothetical protein